MDQPKFAVTAFTILVLFAAAAPAAQKEAEPVDFSKIERIVCLGDSITDGQTYSLILQQGLREAGKPVPLCLPAGIGGDNSAGMLARLDRDVLRFKPQMVLLGTGINDVAAKMKTEEFEANVAKIIERLQTEKIEVVLFTLTTIGKFSYQQTDAPSSGKERLNYNGANAILRKTARKYGCRLAEITKTMQAAPESLNMWSPDGVHLNYAGYYYMTRAIADALGYPDIALPKTYAEYEVDVLPGIIRTWRIRPVKENEKITADSVADLEVSDAWTTYALPETRPLELPGMWWQDQERRRGFVMSLKEKIGPAAQYVGYAEVTADEPAEMWANTGGSLGSVYINSERIFNHECAAGWHAGGHRIPVKLRAGVNKIVIITGDRFFFSLTKDEIW